MDTIINALKRLIAAPVFAEDAEKTRTASLINTILWAGMMLIPLSLLTGLTAPLRLRGLILRLVIVLTCVAILWLIRRGYVRVSATVLVIMLWGVAAAGTYIWGGLRSTGPYLFVIPLVTAGLFLERRSVFLIAALNAACGLLFVWLDLGGRMHMAVDNAPFSLWVSQTVSFSWVAFALYYVMRNRDMAAREVADENKEVLGVRRLLEERNDHLQQVVKKCIDHMALVGSGDLTRTVRLETDGKVSADDPLLLLGSQLNEMTQSLRRMILVTRDASEDLVSASRQIQAAAAQQADGIAEQSSAISGTTQMVNDVKSIAVWASQNAEKMSQVTERSVDVSRDGTLSVEHTIASMNRIKERVEGIAANINGLTKQTQQISQILSAVSDIAAQTNMVAINASVEAARAREEGSGFAVVAAEVRTLADQSRQATAQIRGILAEVQKGSRASVQATEQGIQGVEEGMHSVQQTRQVIEKLAGVIDEIAQASVQLAAGSQQQLASIEEASQAVHKIGSITTKTQASTQETEKAVENLHRLANQMAEIIAPYRV